jgi:hypothetical protein
MIKQRYQNPVIGDTVVLQMFVLNSNNSASLLAVNAVSIYYLDPTGISPANPDGRTLIQTIPGSSVTNPETGQYILNLFVDPAIYTNTGRYIDEWDVVFQPGDPSTTIDHLFVIYQDLWYTTPIPIVYDFSFYFQPNKMRHGCKKFIEIEVIPNVPRATDLDAYYQNLCTAADVSVSISRHCGDCLPCEEDLRIIVEDDPTQFRENNRAFYFIDTEELGCGVFDVWFKLCFGGNTYVSEKNQLLIFQ